MLANLYDKQTLSLYQPPPEVQQVTKYAKEAYAKGHEILTRSWPEFNDLSVIDRENRDKRVFNAYVDESVDDPKEKWKWKGTRSMARNRALAMHAHLTSGFLFPMVSAQDQNNDEDRGVSDFMRDMLIWMGDNSNYRQAFLQIAMGIITSPVNYLGAEFVSAMQKVKEKTGKGYEVKEVLDEELSGFNAQVYGCSEVLITNAYVQDIQRQTCIIKQRWLDYADAEKKYGKHENWEYVQKGINSVLDETTGLFYDVYDPENSQLVKETICVWRSEDLEISFLGGVYMGDENINWNPIKHRDNFNNPKYNVVPFGFHRISEHFFYYKSLCNSLYWDDALIDAMYANVMNREIYDTIPSVLLSGYEGNEITTSVVFPGATIVTGAKDAKAQPVVPPSTANKYGALKYIEESMKEGSLSDTQTGQLPEASQKAYSVAKADQAAKILLKGAGQALGESVVLYGRLMIDIAIRHLSTAQIEEISAAAKRLKYRQFVLPKQTSKGKSVTKILRFDGNLVGKEMTAGEKRDYRLKLYQEAGEDKSIMVLNPALAARMRYLVRIDPEEMFAENREYTQSLLTRLYRELRQDPLIDPETLVRKLMNSFFRSEGDELLAEKSEIEKALESGQLPQRLPPGTPITPLSEEPTRTRAFELRTQRS